MGVNFYQKISPKYNIKYITWGYSDYDDMSLIYNNYLNALNKESPLSLVINNDLVNTIEDDKYVLSSGLDLFIGDTIDIIVNSKNYCKLTINNDSIDLERTNNNYPYLYVNLYDSIMSAAPGGIEIISDTLYINVVF